MARRSYTDAEKAEALELHATVGPAEAARRTGITKGTIESWASRAGLQAPASETTAAAVEASLVSLADRKAQLAADLMGDIERLRRSLWEPCVEKRLMTVGTGDGKSRIQVGECERDQPTFDDQKRIMTTLAIAIDKVQILTGDATERIDHRHTTPIDEELDQLAADLAAMA